MARLFGIITHHPIDFTFTTQPPAQATGRKIHGWGMGWFDADNQPKVQKEKRSAVYGEQHRQTGTAVTSRMILVHQRIATSGGVSDENVHPFTFQNYIFAHIGTVNKEKILAALTKPYGEKFQSEPIDSEVYFRYLVQCMIEQKSPTRGIQEAVKVTNDHRGASFILLAHDALRAYCFGLPLYFMRWNKNEPLKLASKATDGLFKSQLTNKERAFIVASEKMTDDNWIGMDDGEILTIYPNLAYEVKKLI